MTILESIQAQLYTASAVLFEPTRKHERGVVFSVRIRPYSYWKTQAIYGEPQVFRFDHPEFPEMVVAARACTTGMLCSEKKITEDNLADFSRACLSNKNLKEPMKYIEDAIRIAKR